ncbi:N-lysine methyltransferase KMT5A-like isoform X3 [Dreissena polymorpha]|uniref:SET domain-containing protein n=1 Tax=Dreissena polymorpha TaxID=45954 RepID=A0A9D4D1S8_DREPO|nr:N-lysine methyltransferase KMT5A-like isoform X2 [Dreissena polymorpha]XP_052241451.1 N-lysine methyltransferase KMT5A-like isoform X3 [Dreissena polymorpha]KAH3736572.1 hypothetical protein DPMN_043143 [Dreissena polymorpha]
MRSKRRKDERTNPDLVAEESIKKNADLGGFCVDTIPPKGRGVRTEVHRNKGDFLLTYHGELITGEEGNKRELMSVSVFRFFFSFKGKQWCIDSTLEVKSGQFLGRLVNHGKGKEQNCKMKCIEVNKKPYLCLFAQRDIQTGEELLYDYGVSDLPWKSPCQLLTVKSQAV